MSMDDGDADETGDVGPPLPPEDRLWRHPSELSSSPIRRVSQPSTSEPVRPAARWPVTVAAALLGASICGGLLAASGQLGKETEQPVVQKVALTPVVSSPMLDDEHGVAALVERISPSVASVRVVTDSGERTASAVIVRDDGILYTSANSVAGAQELTVVLSDGRRFDAELVGSDLETDVAVLSVHAAALPVAVLADSGDLSLGSPTLAMAASATPSEGPAVATGVVSARERSLDLDGVSLHGLIQTDAPIGDGWSGGPLVDDRGAVIGLTTGLAGERAGFGFATPIGVAQQIAEQLLSTGRVVHAWLGIDGGDLTAREVEDLGVRAGLLVERVFAGGPADVQGIATGDVITKIVTTSVASVSDLVRAVRDLRPGDQVVVGYWRDGDRETATVTCEERP
jgi:S1-C subfamily serine protease